LQPRNEQSRFKISYYINPAMAPDTDEINGLLHRNEEAVNVIYSFGQFLDIVPVRASKGFALRWFADQWDISRASPMRPVSWKPSSTTGFLIPVV
jgi:sucrose-phosphate synthase